MAKKNNPRRTTKLTIEMLTALEEKRNLSQRNLSKELGIALGSTNAYIQKCVAQGWIEKDSSKVKNSYHITDKGLAKKGQLIQRKIRNDLTFYSQLKSEIKELLPKKTPFYIFGTGALAEIAYICALQEEEVHMPTSFLGFIADKKEGSSFLSQPLLDINGINKEAQILFLSLEKSEEAYTILEETATEQKLLVPHILNHILSSKTEVSL